MGCVGKLVSKYPQVLLLSEENVAEKMKYVTDTLHGRPSLFVKCPKAFGVSLRRIQERHLYLLKERYMDAPEDNRRWLTETKFRAIVDTTDREFAEHITKTSLQEFQTFQKSFHEFQKSKGLNAESGELNEDTSRPTVSDVEKDPEEEDLCEPVDNSNEEWGKQHQHNAFQRKTRQISDVEWLNTPFNTPGTNENVGEYDIITDSCEETSSAEGD